MTDLITLLPNIYRTNPALRPLLIRHSPSFDQCGLTTVDLVTLDPRTICQRARISLNDVNRIVEGVRDALNADTLGGPVNAPNIRSTAGTPSATPSGTPSATNGGEGGGVTNFRGRNMEALSRRQRMVEFGDDGVDGFLNGGVMTGSLVEIVGESGVGKTQLLLRLCFSIQQPPHNRSAIYICTESQISTKRMVTMLEDLVSRKVPGYAALSMNRIQTAMCQYLETLEHIVKYQLPRAIEQFGAGLVVVDSIAANFRVDDEDGGGGDGTSDGATTTARGKGSRSAKLARRAGDIVRLGMCLKEMAMKYNVAVVVANQVSDTFEPAWVKRNREISTQYPQHQQQQPPSSSAIVSSIDSSMGTQTPIMQFGQVVQTQRAASQEIPLAMSQYGLPTDELMMTYDYQAKWFNGWGEEIDDIAAVEEGGDEVLIQALGKLKTPMLGMTWTNLLDGRVALVKGSARREDGGLVGEDGEGEGRTRRWVKVVFAPWAESGVLLEYEIWEGGVRSVKAINEVIDEVSWSHKDMRI
ncbi:hypothetical protein TWF192_002350 [Orbilia oligospora]|uniref:Uncharacterized protein n=1 Tax=Orbilia oligospora TaxID=2813651 RepID=A0A6G1MEL9_ORBOL|nr:hypothetical protein TWF191_001703 [Orbilia oligospora]KAF3255918.1 hypothetical protein TWF192_002350 [Orbilia oligospora]